MFQFYLPMHEESSDPNLLQVVGKLAQDLVKLRKKSQKKKGKAGKYEKREEEVSNCLSLR